MTTLIGARRRGDVQSLAVGAPLRNGRSLEARSRPSSATSIRNAAAPRGGRLRDGESSSVCAYGRVQA